MRLPTLIGFHDPGRAGVIRAGKFCQIKKGPGRGRWAYVYNIEDKLRFMDGFGVAPCVLIAMEESGIDQIHYVDKTQKCTWVTSPKMVRERGFPFQGKRGRVHSRGTYLHLPLKYWQRREGIEHYPWLQGPMTWMTWEEPEPVAAPPEQGQLL